MWAATKDNLTFVVDYDSEPMNPRTDWDNFGKMVCWHGRYSLGDKHDYGSPDDFVEGMLLDHYGKHPARIIQMLKRGEAKEAYLKYNPSGREWALYQKTFWNSDDEYYREDAYPARDGKTIPDWFVEKCVQALTTQEKMALLHAIPGFIILPLYLYDHSGITMSTSSFSCPWDSGQVGWIYATAEMIGKEYGKADKQARDKALTVLEGEVQCYDQYLTGECYGYECYENGAHVDSCWGFLGEYEDMLKDLKGNVPSEYEELIDALEYQPVSIEKYLVNIA